jgi:hypothetical protein
MSKPAAASRNRPVPPESGRSFKRGDRVRFLGAGKDWLGVVTERPLPDGTKSIHPRHDDTAVYVRFDETGVTIPVSLRQLEKASDRRR